MKMPSNCRGACAAPNKLTITVCFKCVNRMLCGLISAPLLKGDRRTNALPSPRFSPLHVLEDIAFVISDGQLEGQGCMVALQHRSVIVQNGQLASSVTQEGVGPPGVVHVMNGGCNERSGLVDGI